jgi:DNA/RNA-binding domain of Phe-tRNA-synthetase-like protein
MMITISPEIKTRCPKLQLGILTCRVQVQKTGDALTALIDGKLKAIQLKLAVEDISQLPIAQQTRQGYKATGKDPARYRPSAEALLRRVVQGKGLYEINNVVDALNLISVETAYSIGGYDMDAIKGNITLGIGQAEEPYESIGRGILNIEGLAVLRDDAGAFGTPTSDSARTSVREQTQRFLMVFYDFEGSGLLEGTLEMAADLYQRYVGAEDIWTEVL